MRTHRRGHPWRRWSPSDLVALVYAVLISPSTNGYARLLRTVHRVPEPSVNQLPKQLQLATIVLAPLSIVLCWLSLGFAQGLLASAAWVLVLIISLFWTSLQSLTGDTALNLEEAIGLGGPSPEEEQKRAVLRALKDLEFERSVGKINETDYHQLSANYRREAKRLLKALDHSLEDLRSKAEELLTEELSRQADRSPRDSDDGRSAGSDSAGDLTHPQELSGDAPAPADSAPVATDDSAEGQESPSPAEAVTGPSRQCDHCDARSPLALDECESCGAQLAIDGQILCRSCPSRYNDDHAVCPVCGVGR